MSTRFSIASVFFFFLLTNFKSYYGQEKPNYIYHICPNTTTFTRNSSYFTNLQTLLSSLSSDSASYSIGFESAASGQSPDLVIGLFLCRGDLSTEICRDCVGFAVNDTLTRCPEGKESLIWYDECMLRYSNRNILLDPVTRGGVILMNVEKIMGNQSNRFNDVLFSTMNKSADEAANSSRKFAVDKSNFTSLQTLYGLVQCTPDLTRQDCSSCLQRSINGLPRDRVGGRLLWPSCNSRYELYSFYNETAFAPLSPPSAPPRSAGKGGSSSTIIIAIVVPIVVVVLLLIAVYSFYSRKAKKKTYDTAPANDDGDDITTAGSLQFDFKEVEAATDKFLASNKLGHGGFGEVFKGTFSNGVQIAVKRLSRKSGQGEREFKNEVVVVAKLQHRNLVRLLGFSLQGEERLLVYEFVPNKSLDYFLFDLEKQRQLDWNKRYRIIGGIARGIIYLHQDSRLTIIHRDLKAGNILLDADMNPKIADFGMARIFGVEQTEANTGRVVGTYGYMAPEYAMYGQFSMKSDVYSFGVLVLEIISGKKNSSLYQIGNAGGNMVTHAWRLWNNGSPLELVDQNIKENYESNNVFRCIHIALLCVQEDPEDRPTMTSIVQMLTTSSLALHVPRPPGLFFRSEHESNLVNSNIGTTSSTNKSLPFSIDDATITSLAPR